MGRKILLGVDGVPFEIIRTFAKNGVMPNTAELIDSESSSFKKISSTVPAVSSASWSTIITGENPGEHGIYGFTQMIEGTYTLSFPNFSSLKSEAFWHKKKDKSFILNVPSTYPAKEMNGMHVSGFVSPELEKSVHPKEKLELLKELNYKVDIDSGKAQKSNRLLMDELFDTLDSREKLFERTWKEDWKNYMLVFTGSDRLEHFLWNAYEDENHEYSDEFRKYFRRVDKIIGKIKESLNKDDKLVMLSDHGMESVERNVNLNSYFESRNLLKLSEGEEKKKYNRIKEGSVAFALEHGRIYINEEKKYPNGSVRDREEAIEKVKEELKEFEYDGRKVIKEIKEKEEVYKGDQLHKAPDLIAIPSKGFNLRGKLSEETFEESPMQGIHNENAFMITHNIKDPEAESVRDAVHLLDLY